MKITCCKCEEVLDLTRIFKYRYCKKCHAENMRENRRKHSELPPVAKFKANARSYANAYQRRGKVIKQPCSSCGSEQAEKHHEDYSKPLEVKWLCRPCHIQEHNVIRGTLINQ